MLQPKRVRCVVYTRKSVEQGLEQEFNSLDAQRAACEAYISSRKMDGWELIPDHYDDGGFSGGNMNRPAFQRMFADIRAGKIDMIVCYKIDRLSRRLLDFADVFKFLEEHNVSFCCVTQEFNTSTSMGRMVMNLLMTFAQFEREQSAERVRDKMVSTCRNGFWPGGPVPYGYKSVEKRLVPVPAAAGIGDGRRNRGRGECGEEMLAPIGIIPFGIMREENGMKKIEKEFERIAAFIKGRRNGAIGFLNYAVVSTYWTIGAYVSTRVKPKSWGMKVIDELCDYLKMRCPELRGYGRRQLYNMIEFYDTYPTAEFKELFSRLRLGEFVQSATV